MDCLAGGLENPAAYLVRLAEQQPPCDGVKDVRCDVRLPWLLWRGSCRQEHGVGVEVLQLQAPVAQDLQISCCSHPNCLKPY